MGASRAKLLTRCCYAAVSIIALAVMFWIAWCLFGLSVLPASEPQRRAIVHYTPSSTPSTPVSDETSASNSISKLPTTSSLAKGDFRPRDKHENATDLTRGDSKPPRNLPTTPKGSDPKSAGSQLEEIQTRRVSSSGVENRPKVIVESSTVTRQPDITPSRVNGETPVHATRGNTEVPKREDIQSSRQTDAGGHREPEFDRGETLSTADRDRYGDDDRGSKGKYHNSNRGRETDDLYSKGDTRVYPDDARVPPKDDDDEKRYRETGKERKGDDDDSYRYSDERPRPPFDLDRDKDDDRLPLKDDRYRSRIYDRDRGRDDDRYTSVRYDDRHRDRDDRYTRDRDDGRIRDRDDVRVRDRDDDIRIRDRDDDIRIRDRGDVKIRDRDDNRIRGDADRTRDRDDVRIRGDADRTRDRDDVRIRDRDDVRIRDRDDVRIRDRDDDRIRDRDDVRIRDRDDDRVRDRDDDRIRDRDDGRIRDRDEVRIRDRDAIRIRDRDDGRIRGDDDRIRDRDDVRIRDRDDVRIRDRDDVRIKDRDDVRIRDRDDVRIRDRDDDRIRDRDDVRVRSRDDVRIRDRDDDRYIPRDYERPHDDERDSPRRVSDVKGDYRSRPDDDIITIRRETPSRMSSDLPVGDRKPPTSSRYEYDLRSHETVTDYDIPVRENSRSRDEVPRYDDERNRERSREDDDRRPSRYEKDRLEISPTRTREEPLYSSRSSIASRSKGSSDGWRDSETPRTRPRDDVEGRRRDTVIQVSRSSLSADETSRRYTDDRDRPRSRPIVESTRDDYRPDRRVDVTVDRRSHVSDEEYGKSSSRRDDDDLDRRRTGDDDDRYSRPYRRDDDDDGYSRRVPPDYDRDEERRRYRDDERRYSRYPEPRPVRRYEDDDKIPRRDTVRIESSLYLEDKPRSSSTVRNDDRSYARDEYDDYKPSASRYYDERGSRGSERPRRPTNTKAPTTITSRDPDDEVTREKRYPSPLNSDDGTRDPSRPLSVKDVIAAVNRQSDVSESNREVVYPVFDPRVSNLTSPEVIQKKYWRGTTTTSKKKRST